MGDCGSYTLGSAIAILSLIATSNFNNSNEPIIYTNINLLIIYSILFIPLTDMLFVISKRLFSGASIFFSRSKSSTLFPF